LSSLRQFTNITFHLESHSLRDFEGRDLIVKAAGVPLDSPFIAHAKKHTIPVRMSSDLFAELAGIPVVGITGTRGKSTVTHLVAHILRTAGLKVLLGGNVRGVSTLSLLPDVTPDAIAVLELDSWQLQGFGEARMSPHVAIFTTFLPDHMNYYHSDMRVYFADKANIFLNQQESDTFILGEQVAPFVKEFGYQTKIRAHTEVCGAKDLPKGIKLRVPGEHNRYNAGLACAAARALDIAEEAITAALESCESIPGRLQFLREVRGIKIYNDNNATTPDATVAALRSFGEKKNVILIMGGSDKGLDMSALVAEIPLRCKKVLLLSGAGTERIKNDIPGAAIYSSMQDAVVAAIAGSVSGDVILFSPAFASFGLFKNEYDRNDQFVDAVESL
jgi:UDP-N-acetylmuramoylalanine--D-glutamate ligase